MHAGYGAYWVSWLMLWQAFLGRAVDPPAMEAMDKALSVLEELGAIDANGSLTALGRHIVRSIARLTG